MGPEQASVAADLVCIDALGPGGEYRTRNREPILSTAGVAVDDTAPIATSFPNFEALLGTLGVNG